MNALAADEDSIALIQGLGIAYHLGITESLISEVIATPDEEDRKALLDLLKRFLNFGTCIMPYNWIVEEQAKAYQRDPGGYDWKRLNVQFREAEQEIVRQEFIHSISDETRGNHKEWEKQFRDIYRTAKPAFQKIFRVGSDEWPSLREVTEKLLAERGAHLAIGASLIEKATGTRPGEAQTKDFIEHCPPFKALLVALCFAQYGRCIRPERKQSLGKAGRVDMFSAVYLAYCSVFVTSDDGQCKALTAVSELAALEASIVMYRDFRNELVGLSI